MIGELCAVAAAITWAIGSLLFGRIGRDGVPPGAMNLGKLIVAGALLAVTALFLTGHVVPTAAFASARVPNVVIARKSLVRASRPQGSVR